MEVLLTEAGYKEMQERLEYLKTHVRAEVAEEIKVARGFGDLSENAEYDAAKKRQAEVESEIAELEAKTNAAKIIRATEVEFCDVGKEKDVKKYTIVGTAEADLKKGLISDESPIGSALINAKKGETVNVKLPNGTVRSIKILNVRR
ncbi:MAG: transcription elongation factor GreA [Corallococcus sp.]|nr:transcription elongation factor GreA [Corallococcus sp.]